MVQYANVALRLFRCILLPCPAYRLPSSLSQLRRQDGRVSSPSVTLSSCVSVMGERAPILGPGRSSTLVSRGHSVLVILVWEPIHSTSRARAWDWVAPSRQACRANDTGLNRGSGLASLLPVDQMLQYTEGRRTSSECLLLSSANQTPESFLRLHPLSYLTPSSKTPKSLGFSSKLFCTMNAQKCS